jgi:hypothetical protein
MGNTEEQLLKRQYTVSEFASDETKADLTRNRRRAKWLGRFFLLLFGIVIGFILGVMAANS